MSAPEVPAVVLRFEAHAAPTRRERVLEIQVNNAHTQLDAVIDQVTAQQLFMWLGQQDTSPTVAQIEARRQEIRAEWVGVALAATNRRGPKR